MTPVTPRAISPTAWGRVHALAVDRTVAQSAHPLGVPTGGRRNVVTAGDDTPDPDTAYHWHADDAIAALGSNAQRGLTDDEAGVRLGRYGRNELTAEMPAPRGRRLLAQFQNVLVILLLVATAISAALWAFERDAALPYEAIAIFAVVLLNAAMGFLQESRAEAAVVALRAMFAADASVIRGGERQSVPASALVPGDVIVVEEGDTIPADGRLIESASLQTSEA